jgi:PDZ domain-containing secreted protein
MVGGDLIVAIDGEPVSDPQDMANLMKKHKAGDSVNVTVFHGKNKDGSESGVAGRHPADGLTASH